VNSHPDPYLQWERGLVKRTGNFKLRCVFTHAFTACGCVFKEITLVWANQGNYFENATARSKRTLKTTVATQLYRVCLEFRLYLDIGIWWYLCHFWPHLRWATFLGSLDIICQTATWITSKTAGTSVIYRYLGKFILIIVSLLNFITLNCK